MVGDRSTPSDVQRLTGSEIGKFRTRMMHVVPALFKRPEFTSDLRFFLDTYNLRSKHPDFSESGPSGLKYAVFSALYDYVVPDIVDEFGGVNPDLRRWAARDSETVTLTAEERGKLSEALTEAIGARGVAESFTGALAYEGVAPQRLSEERLTHHIAQALREYSFRGEEPL